MAALNELVRALRDKFEDCATSTAFSTIIRFIENYPATNAHTTSEAGVKKATQNAKNTRRNAPKTTRQSTVPPTTSSQQRAPQASEDPGEGPNSTSYADIARKGQQTTTKTRPREAETPKSLQNTLKPPKAIKITLRNPLKETPKDLIGKIKAGEGDSTAALLKALRPLSKRSLLAYPRDEKARETLLTTRGWLECLQAEIYTRDYYIVVHGIDSTMEMSEVANQLKAQNTSLTNLYQGFHVQWLGHKPKAKLSTIKIGFKHPDQANQVIQQGLVLNYEIKSAYKYRPLQRCHGCKQFGHKLTSCKTATRTSTTARKVYYREKDTLISTTFQARQDQVMEIDDLLDAEEEWTLVNGTHKRRIARPRGRPRLFERMDTSHGNIQGFLVPPQTPLAKEGTQQLSQTQTAAITREDNADTITVIGTQ